MIKLILFCIFLLVFILMIPLLMLGSIGATEHALKKNFDKNGKRIIETD